MGTASATKNGWLSRQRRAIAVVGFLLGVGFIFFGVGGGNKSENKQKAAGKDVAPANKSQKAVRAWNMALGNVVVVAQELGFLVKSGKDTTGDSSRVTARMESQLQGLREFYRTESEKNPSLMGGMIVQLSIGASGEVTQIKELASRITDTEFKKAVLSEMSKWSFQEIVSDVTIHCPLLFVREGMDITTLLQWEKSLGQLIDKSVLARGDSAILIQETKPPASSNATAKAARDMPVAPARPAPSVAAKPVADLYQTKYATSVRTGPNFASDSVGKFSSGTKVSLLGRHGDWLEVRAKDTALSGFIRKEFVTPVKLTRRQ